MGPFSLRTKVLVLILFVTTGVLSLVGYGNYTAAKRAIMEALVDKAGTKVQNAADSLASWIETRRAEVEVMSRTDQVRFGTPAERLAYFRGEIGRSASPYRTIGFADKTGRTELSDGRVIGIGNEPSFSLAIQGKAIVTDPFVSPFGGGSIVVIQIPVYGRDNAIIGLVDAAISADQVFREQLNVRVGRTDLAFVYNDDAAVIEAPPAVGPLRPSASLASPELPFADALQDMLRNPYGTAGLSGPAGNSMLFYAAVEGTSWHLALNVPLREIEAPLAAIKWRSILSIAGAEAILTMLFFLFSYRAIGRIKRILAVTEAAAAGRFDADDVRDAGGDELSLLSKSVNLMKLRLNGMFSQMDAMINQNQFAFIVLDSQYRVTYFSKAAERMLGYQAEEVLHKMTALEFIAPEDIVREAERLSGRYGRPVPPDVTVFELLIKDRFAYEREWTYVRKDGTRFPAAHSSNGMRDREGRFVGVVGIARDITGQKQAENARSRQLKVMGAAKDLIATFDEAGKLLYMNEAGRAMLGMRPYGMSVDEVPARTVRELLDGIEDAREAGYREKEALLRTLQGVFFPVSKILVVHRDDNTGETFYSCIARDITEAKRVQSELEQARRDAESASVAKSQFLAQISHEIRTPLAGIIGLTGLMQKTGLTPLQQDYLRKTRDTSQALLAIINDILDFSKVEAGRIELNEKPFDPYELIQKLAETLSVFVAGKERFQFVAETPKGLPERVVGDWLRLEQVLLNLCVNAIKFTERGCVRLRLSLPDGIAADDGRVRLAFAVEDTGIGMSEEQLGRLFEPFVQADAETNRKYGGTGLGLVIVKRLVELMGGDVRVRSELGRGSAFSFVLDFAVAEPPREDRFAIRAAADGSVWIVEDHPLMSGRLCAVIADSGFAPLPLGSWKTARERLARAGIGVRPSALLLDFEMPDMYAEETWHAMREAAQEASVMTVALTTAYGREELLKLPQEQRPDAILVKPVTRVSVHRALQSLFERRPVREAGAVAREAAAAAEPPESPAGTILLAEDNEVNRIVAVEQLRAGAYRVDVAASGTEALRMLTEKRYDLILMDIHMPDMDGDEAARIIRLDSKYDRMPIIALTANIMQEDHDRYMQLGMNDVLTKPIDPEALTAAIDKWLRAGRELSVEPAADKPPKAREAANAFVPAPAAEDAWLDRGVPGMRLDEALRRVGGKRAIVTRMLALFVREYRGFGDRLASALAAGDYDGARRMAHTLKGVAGNLSAEALFEAARRLETLLKQAGSGPPDGALAEAAAEADGTLRVLLSDLADALPNFDSEA